VLKDVISIKETSTAAANQQLADSIRGISPTVLDDFELNLYCECGNPECEKCVQVPIGDYVRAHRQPHQFVVLARHYFPQFEQIIARHTTYWVIRSIPEAPPGGLETIKDR
jgi:hypothetical protein